ncbi:MAG: hypothetical protein ACRDI3_03375, partial [Actinomycetota bacterium]
SASSPHFFAFESPLVMLVYVSQMFFTLSLGLIPVLLFHATGTRVDRSVDLATFFPVPLMLLALLGSTGSANCCVRGIGSVFLGNLFTQRGVLGNSVVTGNRPELFPFPLWWVISAAAVVAGSLVVRRIRAQLVSREPFRPRPDVVMLAAFGAFNIGGVIFRGVLGGPIFDRYLIPVVLATSILLLRNTKEPTAAANRGAYLVTGLVALVSVALVSSGHSFDVARWRGGEIAASSGIPPGEVDGGFEWVGYHYRGVVQLDAPNRPLDLGPGYLDVFPRAGNCGVVAASRVSNARFDLIDSVDYRTLFGLRSHDLWIYKMMPACENRTTEQR